MTTARAPGRVFMSHSHKDNELVRDLVRRFQAAGLNPHDLPAPLQTYHVAPYDVVDDAIHLLSQRPAAAAKD
jgi:hypothetical protein